MPHHSMPVGRFALFLSCLLGCVILICATSLQAQAFAEVGDAGQTLATAQATGLGGAALSVITGTISAGSDADLFRISITSPTTFSATTTFGGFTALDTALFLFNSAGAPIYTNDDASGSSTQSTLPAGGSFTMTLAPGTYYLGISLSGNEPINSNTQLLFAGFPNGDTTAVRGPAGGISPSALSTFNGNTSFAEVGTYRIDLTGAAAASGVPEPSTLISLAVGASFFALAKRRRSRGL